MPPKAGSKKRAKPGPEVDDSDELDAQLAQIDLYGTLSARTTTAGPTITNEWRCCSRHVEK